MRIIQTPNDLQEYALSMRSSGKSIGLIPTMGAFHEGHLSLIRQARVDCDVVIVTLFVNPAQFGPGEDLEKYPRRLEADREAAAREGVDVLFVPSIDAMYPKGFQTYVELGPVTSRLCGASRPVHFRGVATVVLKLFNICQPSRAYFGLKDYQQLKVIQVMTRDFNLPIEIVPMPIIREPDGVAMSSRNAYLSVEERKAALVLKRSLDAAAEAWAKGEADPMTLRKLIAEVISAEPLARVDYIELADPETLESAQLGMKRLLAALAVFVGPARLIDNMVLA